MDLSLRSIKGNNWSADNLKKKTHHLSESYTWASDTVRWDWSADALFDSCQLTITWMSIRMSTIKLNTDCISLEQIASNAQSLQENNTWSFQKRKANKRAYYMYFTHIIKNFNILSNLQINNNFSWSDYFYEDLKMFKTQVESRAASECFHCKVLNILISLLWSLWEWLQGECWLYIYSFIFSPL